MTPIGLDGADLRALACRLVVSMRLRVLARGARLDRGQAHCLSEVLIFGEK
jgi:hypothetical protein